MSYLSAAQKWWAGTRLPPLGRAGAPSPTHSQFASLAGSWVLRVFSSCEGMISKIFTKLQPVEKTSTGKGSWKLVAVAHVDPLTAGQYGSPGVPKGGARLVCSTTGSRGQALFS